MKILQLLDDGTLSCTSITRKRGQKLYIANMELYQHYKNADVCIMSTIHPNNIFENELHTFILPPPLNTYIYPYPLYICSTTNQELEKDVFSEYCESLSKDARNLHHNYVIYDVPALPTIVSEEVDDIISDGEEEYSNTDEEAESENEWEEDDDSVVETR